MDRYRVVSEVTVHDPCEILAEARVTGEGSGHTGPLGIKKDLVIGTWEV